MIKYKMIKTLKAHHNEGRAWIIIVIDLGELSLNINTLILEFVLRIKFIQAYEETKE